MTGGLAVDGEVGQRQRFHHIASTDVSHVHAPGHACIDFAPFSPLDAERNRRASLLECFWESLSGKLAVQADLFSLFVFITRFQGRMKVDPQAREARQRCISNFITGAVTAFPSCLTFSRRLPSTT